MTVHSVEAMILHPRRYVGSRSVTDLQLQPQGLPRHQWSGESSFGSPSRRHGDVTCACVFLC